MRYRLSPEACSELRKSVERAQAHLAYLFAVEDHARIIAEARHCRAVLHLFAEHGPRDGLDVVNDCAAHVILMETRAYVALAAEARRPLEALYCIDRGLRDLLDHFTTHATVKAYDRAKEVRALERLRRRLVDELFPGPQAELRRALSDALRDERYEDAARLRDRLRGPGSRPA